MDRPFAAFREGSSLLSRGAFLGWTLNNQRPGATLKAASSLASRIEVHSALPIERVEIIRNGQVVRRLETGGKAQFSVLESLPAQSGWYLVQVMAKGEAVLLAMSNPIWVQGKP